MQISAIYRRRAGQLLLPASGSPLQVGALAEAGFEVGHEAAGVADREAAAGDGGFAGDAQAFEQQFGVVFHHFEHFGVGVPAHHVFDAVAAAVVEADVDGVGGAEEVVEVAHHLLVGAGEEEADPVGLTGAEGVEFEQGFVLAAIDEAGEFAIGIAGEIGEGAEA